MARATFLHECEGLQFSIRAHLQAHQQVLLGGVALFEASTEVERREWHAYVARLELNAHFRGVQGLGFAPRVTQAQLPAYLARVRQAGFPEHHLFPEGTRPVYAPVEYLEPFTGRNLRAFGFDMYSDPVRRNAMVTAMEQGVIMLSGKVQLRQEDGHDVQAGTLMYAPVYRKGAALASLEARRAALIGWVFSPFRMRDLLQESFLELEHDWAKRLHLKVYDGHAAIPAALMYDSNPHDRGGVPTWLRAEHKIRIAGRLWTLQMESGEQAQRVVDYRRAGLILFGGVMVSVLLALLLDALLNTRRRAQKMADTLTAELQQRAEAERTLNERLALQSGALSASANAIAIFDRWGVVEWVNPAFVTLTGYSAEEAIGHTRSELLGNISDQPNADEERWQTMVQGDVWAGELLSRRKDGSYYQEMVTFTPIRDAQQQVTHVVAVKQDVTQRVEAEQALQQQLRFAQAMNKLSRVILSSSDATEILQAAVRSIGIAIQTDRVLIYNADFVQDKAIGLCEWLNPRHGDVGSSKSVYPLSLFANGVKDVWRHRRPLISNTRHIHPLLQADGSWEVLHQRLHIMSLLWHPFAFHENGFYMLVLNDVHQSREWLPVEIDFLDSMSHQAGIALEKIRFLQERQRVEEDLRIAATAFESQECMLILNENREVLRSNKAFSTVTGYNAAEIMGKPSTFFRSNEHEQAFYQSIWQQVTQQGSWEGEAWSLRKNGESFPTNLTISAVRDRTGHISHYVATFTDISASKAAEIEIQHLAFYDALTQLPNRRLLRDRLRQAIVQNSRLDHHAALLFIDLDNFKTLNDTLGHDMGDLLLQQVAQRLLEDVRESDTVARLGGDEFVVLLTNLHVQQTLASEQAMQIAEKILVSLNRSYRLVVHEYSITPSIGITVFSGHDVSIDSLMRQSDIAMYQAKKSGKNGISLFDPSMEEAITARVTLERALRLAIPGNELLLAYQVQVDAQHNAVGVEALIRWNRPGIGIVPPADFVALAEETGLVLPMGWWVMRAACAQLRIWADEPRFAHLSIAVNVSPKQFRQPDFVEQVHRLLTEFSILPGRLKLEVTESLLLEDADEAVVIMSGLQAAGVSFALDDFGTGYSSLLYLKRLPIDQLKIDQSFVRDITVDNNDKTIVSTIIAMAHSLNIGVIAEGVETVEQKRLLHALGCLHYQGYLFGKPMLLEQLEQLPFFTPSASQR